LQQTARTANLPNSPIGTNALTNVAQGRPYIEIATSGNAGGNTTPAVYGCDANNNNIFNEPGDGEWVACNYLNWPDLAAYLAWAGLSPMTELQYEKICRGPVQPVSGEYPWGNTQVSNNVYTLSAAGFTNETVTNPSSNVLEGNASYSVTNASIPGPFRNGIFATAASNRISSGGSFYGVMDMAGNMWERVVTTATTQGRAFDGSNGGYAIISLGFAGQTNWPGGPSIDGTNPATGLIYRGGSSHFAASYMRVSDRSILETGTANTRFIDQGGRGVRNL
jgi:formylglycine-generating enzyme required for sulfatase activity